MFDVTGEAILATKQAPYPKSERMVCESRWLNVLYVRFGWPGKEIRGLYIGSAVLADYCLEVSWYRRSWLRLRVYRDR